MNARGACIVLALGMTGFAVPLGAQGGANEAQKKAVQALMAAWNAGDTARLGDLIAPKGRWSTGGNSYPWSPRGEGAVMKAWRTAFPDARIVVEDLFGEGDRVVARTTWTGTHQGALSGIPATGRKVKFSETMVFRFEAGLMIENWTDWDELGLYRQLGALPPGSPAPLPLPREPAR